MISITTLLLITFGIPVGGLTLWGIIYLLKKLKKEHEFVKNSAFNKLNNG